MMLVGVESVYFRAFFCLCAAVTVVASFLIRPIAWRPKWADSLVKKWNRKRTEPRSRKRSSLPQPMRNRQEGFSKVSEAISGRRRTAAEWPVLRPPFSVSAAFIAAAGVVEYSYKQK